MSKTFSFFSPTKNTITPSGRGFFQQYRARVSLAISGVAIASFAIVGISHAGVPTYSNGGPSGGQTFVPMEALIDVNMNEAVKSATATTANITLKKCLSSTDASSCSGIDSDNKCTSISTNSANIQCVHSAPLNTDTTYEFRVTTAVQSNSTSQGAAADFVRVFRTGSFSGSNNTVPPRVTSCIPSMGSQDIPTNIKISCDFPLGPEGAMKSDGSANAMNNVANVTLHRVINGVPDFSTEVCTSGSACTMVFPASSRHLSVKPTTSLTASTDYEFCIKQNAQNEQSVPLMAPYCMRFRTGTGDDSTAPTLRSTNPSNPVNAVTGVDKFTGDMAVSFSEAIDSAFLSLKTSVAGAGTVGVCADANTSSTCDGAETYLDASSAQLNYDNADKTVHINPMGSGFSSSTRYCLELIGGAGGGTIRDLVGNRLATTQYVCFTTGTNSDAANPKLLYAEADTFKIVAHLNEAIKKLDLVDVSGNLVDANITLQCPTGVTVPLTGKKASYNGRAHELEIQGVGLPPGQTCQLVIGTGVHDLANNTFSAVTAEKTATFQILNATTTGGSIGSGNVGDFQSTTNFATFAQFPQRCNLQNQLAGKTTNFMCEMPVPAALATGAKLLLTFPSGFDVSSVTAVTASSALNAFAGSPNNADINGPGAGTTTIYSVSNDATSNTITIALTHTGTAMGASDMLRFDMSGLVNPTIPNANAQVSIIVKDASGVKVGQTINTSPLVIQEGGALSIAGKVCKGAASDGVCGGGDTGIGSVRVFCDSMGGFGASGAFAGHQETTTAGNGTWSITGLSAGQYSCGLPPDPTNLASLGGGSTYQMVSLSTSKTDAYFKFIDLAATGKTLTVNIAGPASKTMDVFCQVGGDANFSAPTMKMVALDGAGAGSTTLKLQGGKTYTCGLGPHTSFDSMGTGAAMTVPTFDFMPPKPVQVIVPTGSNPTAVTFALLTASNLVNGTVKDSTGTGVANVFVHARPIGCFNPSTGAAQDCNGGFSQTKSDGTFTLNLVQGTYEVGADAPGMPSSAGVEVSVAAQGAVTGGGADGNSTADVTSGGVLITGASPFVIKILKTSVTIAGTVKDETGNGIKYAQVHADKISTGGSCSSFTPVGGSSDAPTDGSGNYTLYVSNGTYCVRAFSPTYGEVANTLVVISSDTSATGQNLQATAASYGTISGTAKKNNVLASGAFVNCYGTSGGNQAQSGSDGTYSMKLKAGTYTCQGFIPGAGPLTPVSGIVVAGSGSNTVNLSMGNPGTVNVTVTGITDAFIDVRDASGQGASTGQNNAGVYTILVPAGTYKVRGGSPKYGDLCLGQSVTVTAGGTHAITCAPPTTLRTVAAKITDGTANVAGAMVTLTESTTGRAFSLSTDAKSTGTANLSLTNVPDGVYTLVASKKGYEAAKTTATVSGGNLIVSAPIAMTPATGATGTAVTVSVQASSTAYQGDSQVIATNGTKTVAIQADPTTGQASVPLTNGTWTVKAVGDNGKESATTTITVAGGVLSGSAPTLSLATAITGYTAAQDTATMSPTSGGLVQSSNIVGLAVNVPGSTLSTTDSTTGKVEMATDPTIKDIDPGADMNFVGTNGYDITPKDSNGNKLTTTTGDPVTLTIPYTDADVTVASVDESKLLCGTYNVATQAWETLPTTVDTTNNLLTCTTTHFSSFGVLGSVSIASAGGSAGDVTPPAAPTNVKVLSDGSRVTITWTDPADSDLHRVEILRNAGGATPIDGGNVLAAVDNGVQKYVDTAVTAGQTYKYQLRAKDTSSNQSVTVEFTIKVEAAVVTTPVPSSSSGGGGGASAPATPVPSVITPASPAAPLSSTTPAVAAAPVAKLIHDPALITELLQGLSIARDPASEAKYQPLVKSDAIAFKVGLTAEQETALTNFIAYGNSAATVKLGAGERRALIRDYMETVGRADASWDDMDRMARGEKPVGRNLAKEQAKAKVALALWMKVKTKTPNFQNPSEDLAWNTLMYRIRFDRDLSKEKAGAAKFRTTFKRSPVSPMDWAMVRALGYVL